jgi:predicted 3-demethylubiquinone-9 3-methyltransferase (glyoxalase superfamily)
MGDNMQKIQPCLWYSENNSEEAMKFYTSIFPNSQIVSMENKLLLGGE